MNYMELFEDRKIAINCSTYENFALFLSFLKSKGYFITDEANNNWYIWRSYTCLGLLYGCKPHEGIHYNSAEYFSKNGYKIIPYEEFMGGNEMKFTLDDLKIGQVVQNRYGDLYIVAGDENNKYFMGDSICFCDEIREIFDKNLKNKASSDDDITKVYKIIRPFCLSTLSSSLMYEKEKYLELIWERKEPREMTVEEISVVLGYEVKIVK